MNYGKIDQQFLDQLTNIMGKDYVVPSRGPIDGAEGIRQPVGVVVKPGSTGELARLMKLADLERIPVTTWGVVAAFGRGGLAPGGLLLSMERFNRVIDMNRENRTMVVEPTVTLNRIRELSWEEDLFYAGDPGIRDVTYIGNFVAGNLRGGQSAGYNCACWHLVALEVVLPDGEVTILDSKPVRGTGYNLAGLITGSRDTLAVITKIHLKLTPLPRYAADLLVVFPDREAAARLVPRIMSGETVPARLEYMDNLTISAAERYLNCKLPHGEAGACLIVGVEDHDEDRAAVECETLERMCREHGAVEIFIGDSISTRQRIRQPGQCHPHSLQAVSRDCRVEDIFVPVARIPEVLSKINSLAGKFGIKVACCGHAGDGHLHAVPIREEQGEHEWQEGREKLLDELRSAVRAMGGQVLEQSACPTKDILTAQVDPVQLKMIRAIKAALDPNYILNPDLLSDYTP